MTRRIQLTLCTVLAISGSGLWYAMAAESNLPLPELRAAAKKSFDAGNFRDAYDTYHKLVLDERNGKAPLAEDLDMAWQCLARLSQTNEQDALLQGAVEAHPNDPRVWWKAASLLNRSEHYGVRVAGEFRRGRARGGGEPAQSVDRDRVQALRWMKTANSLLEEEITGKELANFWSEYASLWAADRMYQQAWRLQALTNLDELPDYEIGYYGRGRGRGQGGNQGAPVDADGNPVFHYVPESLEAAKSDGERWRFCLEQTVVAQPERRIVVDFQFAQFLQSQFGVQTLQQWGIVLPRAGDQEGDEADPATSLVSLKSLGENETIARLANGVKRFTLPDEFNFIRIYQQIDTRNKGGNDSAQQQLAQIFENRQQYDKAAEWRRKNLEQFGKNDNGQRQKSLDQIVSNWGQFEPIMTQPAGQGATVGYKFRNGDEVNFEAHALKIPELLEDVKAYLKSKPQQLDWQKLQIDNVGYQIVQQDEKKYLGERVAQWSLELNPRAGHFDRRVTVTTPLQKAGAYLVTAKMKNGNTSRIIIWLDDTAIVKKQLNGQVLYYIADAISGQPIEKANVEFFGWRHEHIPNTKRDFRTITRQFAEFSGTDGMLLMQPKQQENNLQWLITARTDSGRFAHLGFTGVWYGQHQSQKYQQHKIYVVTDRPVYRPEQKVQFKFWAGEAKYDAPDENPWKGKSFTVKIHDPQGNEISSQELTADEYGGFSGEFDLGAEAALGQYSLTAHHPNLSGHGNFRVEEYKKPEFEVTVKAPEKPVQLGEKVSATIQAKYYFGAPVQHAKVQFKVERSPHETRWYPAMPWDWMYGEGYWWFASDYDWYPGFAKWGCVAPRPHWIHWNPAPPELVLDQEVEIGEDGTVQVEIDTALAKALHGDEDHEYTITAEVTDASRRTIVGTGKVLVAREPFKVFTWVDRGHYQVGDTVHANFQARTPDGQGVEGTGKLKLLKIRYDEKGAPIEEVAQEWDLNTNDEGRADLQLKASAAGQYRLSYSVTSEGDNVPAKTIEGGYLFVVRGEGFDGSEYQFNDLELITNKREYAPGEKVELLINTNRVGSTVLLFVRPENGIYNGPPQVLQLKGKSTSVEIEVTQSDMPNYFVEAITISGGKVHSETREVIVPPEKRILNVKVLPSEERYSPGEEANIRIKITDLNGEPFVGSTALAVYDRSVEYISGGSNVPEIREFFWKWRRRHNPRTEHNLQRNFWQLLKVGEQAMANLGVFGGMVADVDEKKDENRRGTMLRKAGGEMQMGRQMEMAAAPMAAMAMDANGAADKGFAGGGGGGEGGDLVQPTVRTNFADTAYWNGMLTTNKRGIAKVSFNMPENLTGWKLRAWGVGNGTRVGEGTTEVVTAKDLLVRLQAPRFFVEKDEVVLSAIVHNYLADAKEAQVELKLEGGTLETMEGFANPQTVTIPPGGEVRVDWRCKAIAEGNATITMSALTNEESDAMQITFPVYVHGFLKTESFSGVIRPGQNSGTIDLNVPTDRRPEQSRLEIRYSPTLAGAMVDALPYLASYPYGCTEQTLNRFVPTVITQHILQRMNLDLAAIRDKRTNLNAQEIGDDTERAKQWKHWEHNPVFDAAEVTAMVKKGVEDLTAMQNSDGGWGWFSGYGERSYPHTTAVVVHGLQLAQDNDVALVPGMLERGLAWLKTYEAEQVKLLKEAEFREDLNDKQRRDRKAPYKTRADNTDALVFMILCEADQLDTEMQRFLFRDRLSLTLYSQAVLGLALHEIGAEEQRDMVITNIDQFLTVDNENQTAYIDLPNNNGGWWYWHGNTIEANAFYLKLLSRVKPQDPKAAGLVKYLLNNRRNATYWNNTRDTAYCIEALAEYLTASGEGEPNALVEVWIDGELKQSVEITPEVLFTFDNKFVLEGDALTSGPHKIELRTKPLNGDGKSKTPLYYNAYLTNFSTEDFITKAGLEIKVQRKFYKLVQRDGATDQVQGASGQVIDQKALKYDRVELPNLSQVTSGDLIEIELEIDSKNDYEYVVFEDLKAAGCEPVDVQSGYIRSGLGAYVEFRDEKVAFFLRTLARGKHSVSYRVRAETPGKFSALPTNGYAMYAPELKANSDEMKLRIADSE